MPKSLTPATRFRHRPEPIPIPKGLTKKRQSFCENYINNGGNATKALREAGYSCTTDNSWFVCASQLLRKPNVQEYIKSLREALQREAIFTMDELISGLREVAKRGLSEEEVFDRDGNPTGVYKSDLNAAKGALDSLGKTIGAFIDKSELSGPNGAPLEPVTIYLPAKDGA